MTNYQKKYEWTAFTEADLLANGKNGHDFGKGDSFVMGHASVKMATFDNDGALSGAASSWFGKSDYAADRHGQDGYVNGTSVGCKMYAEQYHVLKGSDGKTYHLIEIKIEGHDSAGAGNGYFTFYGAQPAPGMQLTVTSTCGVSGSWIDYSCLGAGKSAPPNTPPTFTNVPANGVFCVDENTRLVIDLDGKDTDGDAVHFAIQGGDDAKLFQIDAKTGELSFKNAPDFEAPADKNGDNAYKVIVSLSDGKGGVVHKELTVTVKDVDEAPKCIIIEAEDMKLSCYSVKHASSASDGQYIALTGYHGSATQKFDGPTGEYDFTLRFWDAAKGDGFIKVLVNGKLVETIRLNAETNTWSEASIEGLDLKKGDVITLQGYGKGCEFAIIDKIKLCPAEPEIKPGALEGRLFVDANRDGIDNAEAGVSGVTVQLLNAAGTVVGTVTTGTDGGYRFDGLRPGDYRVVFPTEVEGRVLTDQNVGNDDRIDSDADVTTGITDAATVVSDQITRDVDAGIKDPGTAALEGRIFIDANDNAVDDAEPGAGGVSVRLLTATGVLVAVTVTAPDGSYAFAGLDAGDYVVEFPRTVDGRVLVDANVGADDRIDSDAGTATGRTGTIALQIGELSSDNDAGLRDPATASLGNRLFLDANKNGIQDAGETGVADVTVTLYDANGAVTTTTTDANGLYLFAGLKADTYSVGFAPVDDFLFTFANAGTDDAIDSDADAAGRTGPVSLSIGETNDTLDAGLIKANKLPAPVDDAAKTCADTVKTVDVLKNDTDADGDALTITTVAGKAIVEGGSITTANGTIVSLVDGNLVVNGKAAYAGLDIGQTAVETIAYTVTDGQGGQASAELDMTFCGDANTLASLVASLPDGVSYQIASGTKTTPFGDFGYDVKTSDSGDGRLDGIVFQKAYCLSLLDPAATGPDFATAPVLTGDLLSGTDGSAFSATQRSFANGQSAAQNLDLINWLINADFEGANSNAADGAFSGWEVQRAIWELTDRFSTDYLSASNPGYGNNADVDYLVQQALTNGEGFVAGDGDIATLIIDPNPTSTTNSQPFILAFDYDDLDCLCYA